MNRMITIYREDMNNSLHGNLFNGLLEDLGINTHVMVGGRSIDREIESVELQVVKAVSSDDEEDAMEAALTLTKTLLEDPS